MPSADVVIQRERVPVATQGAVYSGPRSSCCNWEHFHGSENTESSRGELLGRRLCSPSGSFRDRHFFFPDPSGYPGDGPHLCCPCPTSEEGEGPEQRSLFVLRPEVSTRAFSHTPLTHVAIPSCRGSWKVEPNRAVVCVTIIMEEGDDCLISATDVWRKLFSFLSILLGEAFYWTFLFSKNLTVNTKRK